MGFKTILVLMIAVKAVTSHPAVSLNGLPLSVIVKRDIESADIFNIGEDDVGIDVEYHEIERREINSEVRNGAIIEEVEDSNNVVEADSSVGVDVRKYSGGGAGRGSSRTSGSGQRGNRGNRWSPFSYNRGNKWSSSSYTGQSNADAYHVPHTHGHHSHSHQPTTKPINYRRPHHHQPQEDWKPPPPDQFRTKHTQTKAEKEQEEMMLAKKRRNKKKKAGAGGGNRWGDWGEGDDDEEDCPEEHAFFFMC